MAIASTYNTGTASINAGETAVTGQGTTWLTSGIRAGDLFWAAGFSVRIASVNSNTSLTLAYAWPGANRAAAAYEIRYTPDAERVLASTREMLTALGANAISPLVGLVPAANKLAYYTGAGAAALTDLTTLARGLLDDADQAAMQATLGLTGNGIGNLTNGTFGTYISAASDFYAFADGFRGLVNASGSTNAPPATPGVLFWWCEQQKMYINGAARLRATGYVSAGSAAPVVYEAIRAGDGTWGPWARVVNSRNILGTVSQSSGVPTGAIIERGSNANGDYVRFADGTQICVTLLSSSASEDVAWTFPASFANTSGLVGLVASGQNVGAAVTTGVSTISATGLTFNVLLTSSGARNARSCRLLAVGRWF